MTNRAYKILLIVMMFPILTGILWYVNQTLKKVPVQAELLQAQQIAALGTNQVSLLPLSEPTDNSSSLKEPGELREPVEDFTARITKKTFGIYITPENSPVEHDRFTGYHAGVDAEYEDVPGDVPVRAIEAGKVIVSQFVRGYGGAMVILHTIDGKSVQALYGHLDPASMVQAGSAVAPGQTIGILGDGGTEESDGARKHLHFALLKKEGLDLRGYVLDQAELADWHDPLDLYAPSF